MDLKKYIFAALLLLFCGQSQALFMPEDFTVNDPAAESDGGCGVIDRATGTGLKN